MITKFKLYESSNIIQQPFWVHNNKLYVSDEIADYLLNIKCKDNKKKPYKNIYPLCFVGRYSNNRYIMDLHLYKRINYRQNVLSNRFGEFVYYLGGRGGDFEMHGKSMIRATKTINMQLMSMIFPIVDKIPGFIKDIHSGEVPFYDLLENSLEIEKYDTIEALIKPIEIKQYPKLDSKIKIDYSRYHEITKSRKFNL